MNRVTRLLESYARFIEVPWRDDVAPAQRVIFCVYDQTDELRVRARVDEFEIATREAGHDWYIFDLTDTFAEWLSSQRYAESYFRQPGLLVTLLPQYLTFLTERFTAYLAEGRSGGESVIALKGVGALFGLIKVKVLVDKLAPMVKGRLLVLFPGVQEGNNYRLLDGYDGWNYLAVPITADKDV
ncbi:MAG: DUF1788 domain-containing protein [Acidobacteria bacterium]|nr:DUF1788 domain-containing protein [Acidobacteriota bacterium]